MPEDGGTKGVAKQAAPPPAVGGSPSGGPLSMDQLDELEAGRKRARKVRRAAGVAAFSGWSMALFALVSLAMGLGGDWTSVAAGAVLAAAAFNELKGGERLKKFEVGAAKQLGYGQMALGVAVVLYALWGWHSLSKSPLLGGSGLSSSGNDEAEAMLRDINSSLQPMIQTGSTIFYGLVGVVGLLTCWLTARYYFSRAKIIRQLRERTPAWVLEVLMRAG